MTEQSPFLVAPYEALAHVYDRAGFALYAERSIANYIGFAHSLNWAGRRVLDVGCGTGVSTWWITENGYQVAGIDNNPYMLDQARTMVGDKIAAAAEEGLLHTPPDLIQGDVRTLESPMGLVDLVLAMGNVFNALQSFRDLEHAFQHIHAVLEPGKLLLFDLYTIKGLSANQGGRDVIAHDNADDLTIMIRNRFSFETLTNTRHYLIFQRGPDGAWQRQDEHHTERGYPVQGIVAMLERNNFTVKAVLNPDMTPFDADEDPYGMALFAAEKQA